MPVSRIVLWTAAALLAAALLVGGLELADVVTPLVATALTFGFVALAMALLVLLATTGDELDRSRAVSLEASFAASEEIIVFSVDANGAVAKWNRGAERALGYTAAEIVGQQALETALGAEGSSLLTELKRMVETGRPHVPRKRMLRSREGRDVETLSVLVPVSRDGRTSEVVILATEMHLFEESDDRRARYFDEAPAGFLRMNAAGELEIANRQFVEWTGRRIETLAGTDLLRSELLPERVREAMSVAMRRRKSGARPAGEGSVEEVDFPLITSTGGVLPLVAVVAPRADGGADAVFVDGTSRRRLMAERDAARNALSAARETAAERIETTTRELSTTVERLVSAMELAKDDRSGPLARAELEAELVRSGKHLMARFAEPRKGTEGAPPRVLLVDDNDENRELIAHMLRSRGAAVVAVGSGREAIEAASRESFTFVLLDVQMPEMDGYQALHRLRALPGGEKLPVLALTALTSETVRDQCLAEGMDDYVAKPLNFAKIVELLKRWGGGKREAAQPLAPERS